MFLKVPDHIKTTFPETEQWGPPWAPLTFSSAGRIRTRVFSPLDYYVLVQIILKVHDHIKTKFTVTKEWGPRDLLGPPEHFSVLGGFELRSFHPLIITF